ncbi:nucleoside triphosphate pyrophosphohydrolase [Catenovulum sp. 2E275]|uniref:nucleoside triphosphate pyrophosphohydrolase n=1 Tax=Catenovulum sp. 2E275 TaxID=2980497 RepID=UPI0021D0219C|nr:nucleoside triphosphate pyrophosphohydrolase [Catenovulum sp. 2E275]MCU4676120.1 nucleoside triphosphate pyrophosphohydrolase [Catenovulum sp. 2E275]
MSEVKIEQLIGIMAQLRDPKTGCPWDLKQNFQSIIPYTLEEAYEVADAIEQQDFAELKLELGDLLFQVVFYCQLAKEENKFDFKDVVDGVCEKLIRRHPHVFSTAQLLTEEAIKENWEAEKAKERAAKLTDANASIFDNVPQALPALTRAKKLQKRCVNVGFDWPDVKGTLEKVKEEIAELEDELNRAEMAEDKVAEELGDLMFALVNVNRHLKLDPEMTLRAANQKFEQRFRYVEQLASEQQKTLQDMSLEEMDYLWEKAKCEIKKRN